MRRLLVLLVALAAVLVPASVAVAADPVELDRGWEVARDPAGPWKQVTVPHVLDGKPDASVFDGGIAYYRLRFTGPRNASGGWALRFEGVRRRARVTLNGRVLGTNSDPYTPFTLNASSLRQGKPNTLFVRVDNRRTRGVREGWWNWGGITRTVRLLPRGAVSMRGVAVLPSVDCSGTCTASATVDGWVESRSSRPVRPLVTLRLTPPGGRGPVTTRTFRMRTVKPGETAKLHVRVPVAGDPQLWAPEKPQLYGARVQLRVGSRVSDATSDRLGLRTVRVRDGRLWLNGRRIELRGASIQEDMPGRGPALTDADIDEIVGDLKALGANVTRAHYLLDERLLDRLDEEGILVWSQAPVYHRDVQLRTDAGRTRELATVRRTVLEARRHPSVLTHSVANELSPRPDANPTTRAWLDAARTMVAGLDPSVPVSVDVLGWPGFTRQSTYAAFPLIGVNSYFGWYQGDEQHYTGRLADLEPFLRTMHSQYPQNALVMTEFGAESTMDGPADVKETYAFQSQYVKANLELVERLPWMNGAIYWTLREFAVKPEWDGGAEREDVERDSIHNKAIMTYDGTKKPAWDVVADDFAKIPFYSTPMPRAVAPSLADPPVADDPSGLTKALAAFALAVLLALAGALLWLGRALLRGGGPPRSGGGTGAGEDELAERRRLRAAA